MFSLTPPASPGGPWTEAVYSFPGGSGGAHPYGGLGIGRYGVLYGIAGYGGTSNFGAVFSVRPPASQGKPWIQKVLYSFTGGGDGAYPRTGVVVGSGGVLYGTTVSGGVATTACGTGPPIGCGTVFSLRPPASPGGAWTETVLYSFTGVNGDGGAPMAGVVLGSKGGLYGTTWGGGTFQQGTVFSLSPPASAGGVWSETILYSFTNGSDGVEPSGVVIGAGGTLYGTTPEVNGSNGGNGSVFSLTPPASAGGSWTQSVLFNFPNFLDIGAFPSAGVAIGSGGVLYGTTVYGRPYGQGSVFSLAPPDVPGDPWTAVQIHGFRGGSEGAQPTASIVIDNNSVLTARLLTAAPRNFFATTAVARCSLCFHSEDCADMTRR